MEPDDSDELFQLAQDDYSLQILETIFGGIIPALLGEGGDATAGTLLSELIGLINLFVLTMAAVVGTYTVWSLSADTASDGTALGRSSDTKYTLLRFGMGAVALIPVNGGFSVIQLLAIWLMGQGAALADSAWKRVADNTLEGASYISAPSLASDTDWRVRGEFAEAIRGLASGHLCSFHLNRLAAVYVPAGDDGEGGIPAVSLQTRNETVEGTFGSRKVFEMYFEDPSGFYRNSDNICGGVDFVVEFSWFSGTDEVDGNLDYADGEITFTEAIDTIAKTSAFNNTTSVLATTVNNAAVSIATEIFSGARDEAAIATIIEEQSTAAAEAFITGHAENVADDDTFTALEQSIRELVTRNGWVFAANWQRGLSAGYLKMQEVRDNLEIGVDATVNIDNYFGTGFWGGLFAQTTVSEAAYRPIIQDYEFLESFDGVFASMALPTSDFQTDSQQQLEDSDSSIKTGRVLSWLYGKMLDWMDVGDGGAGWTDPMLDYQQQGASFIYAGSGILAAGAGLDLLGDVALAAKTPVALAGGAAKAANEYVLEPTGQFLIGAGLAMLVFIPLMPMLYFFSAVIGWVLLCVEAMFAIPLAVLLWFAPAREQSLVGPWQKIALTLFGLLMRPAFAVIGLVACLVVLNVGLQLQLAFFRGLFTIMTPEWTPTSIFIFIGLIVAYVIVAILLSLFCSQLITGLGDWVLNWIGIGASGAVSAANAGISDRTLGIANPAGRVPIADGSRLIGGAAGKAGRTAPERIGKAARALSGRRSGIGRTGSR